MWWELVPYLLATMVVVLLPGVVVNIALGFRPLPALGFAPGVSTGIIAVAAILAERLGFTWGIIPILVVLVVVAGSARSVSYFLAKPQADNDQVTVLADLRPSLGWLAPAMIGALIGLVDAVRVLGRPDSFSQTFDNIFHLSVVRWILDTGNASSLDMAMTSSDGGGVFYPLGWHDIVSATLRLLGGTDVVLATNALIITVLAVIWPGSLLVLVATMIRATPVLGAVAVIVGTAFAAFPYLLLGFGVLYPNLLGLVLLPATVAGLVRIFGLGAGEHWPAIPIWGTTILGGFGVALAHPNAALTVIVVFGPVVVSIWTLRGLVPAVKSRSFGREEAKRLVVLFAWLSGSFLLFSLLRPSMEAAFWGPQRTWPAALIEAASLSPLRATINILAAGLALIGWAYAAVNYRYRWLAFSHLLVVLLWLVGAAYEVGEDRYNLVGPWYCDPHRLAALLPLTGIPLAVLAVHFLAAQVTGWVERTWPKRASVGKPVLAFLTAVILLVGCQAAPAKSQIISWSGETYQLTDDAPLVDADEYALIRRIPQIVGPGERIVVNPWNGSSMVYALTGQPTTATHVLFEATDDQETIRKDLDELATDPDVCPALARLDAWWVLDFGLRDIINESKIEYPGWNRLKYSPGFEEVARENDAVLYRVTGCD